MILRRSRYFKVILIVIAVFSLKSCVPPEIDTADFTIEIALSGDFENFDKEIEIVPRDFNLSPSGRTSVSPAVTTSNTSDFNNEFVSTLDGVNNLLVFVESATTVELEFMATTTNTEPVEMTITIIVERNGEVLETFSMIFDNSSTESNRVLKDYFVEND